MKYFLLSMTILFLAATAAQAACYADYKAKQDDPLRLHYGVALIEGDCTVENAETELTERLAVDDWQMLNVLEVFDEDGLQEREDSAGEYYLRY